MQPYRAVLMCATALLGVVLGTRVAQAKSEPQTRRNVLGGPLQLCCTAPATGFFRDGLCRAAPEDPGMHTVCARVDQQFLDFTARQGNDLTTPRPGFVGLKPKDSWCLCAGRWLEAQQQGAAPKVDLVATDEATLQVVSKDLLVQHAAARP